MNLTSLSCPTCGGPAEPDPKSPTMTCKFCGSVMQNPFYKGDDDAGRVAMPVININVGGPQQGVAMPYGVPSAPARTESTKNWLTTLFLCVFLGVFGAHRFYTGHIVIGVIQLFTFGFAGIWTFIDFLLIVFGAFRDSQGLPLSGRRGGVWAGVAALVLVVLVCVGLYSIGVNASKVDVPAETGWITGIERCTNSGSFNERVVDKINVWQGWGDERGSIIGTVDHDTEVDVLEARRETSENDHVYYKIRTPSGLTGWVSEAFIQFQPLSDGIVPREDC